MRTLLALLLCALSATAKDHATLKSGVLVTGDVVSVHREGFVMETEKGPRFFSWDELGSPGLQTTNEVAVVLANGDRITARITGVEGGRLLVTAAFIPEARIPTDALRPRPIPSRNIQEEIPPGALQDAEAKGILEEKDWNGNVALLGTFRSGNTDSALFQLNAGLNRQWTSDRFNAYASAAWGETEGEQTAANVLGGAKWDHFYNADFYSYARVEAEHDEIKNLDFRLTTGIGAGINVWRGEEDHQSLDLEGGLDYLHQSFDGQPSSDDIAGRFAFLFKTRFFGDWLFTEDFEVLFPLSDPGEFIIHSTTKLETALSESWYLQNILEIEYRGDPPSDTEELDLKLLIGLEYKF